MTLSAKLSRENVRSRIIEALHAAGTREGQEWSGKNLGGLNLGSGSTPYQLLSLKARTPWTEKRIRKLLDHTKDAIQWLTKKADEASSKNQDAGKDTVTEFLARIQKQEGLVAFLQTVLELNLAQPARRSRKRDLLKAADAMPLGPSEFAHSWPPAKQGLNALLAALYIRHGDLSRLHLVANNPNRETTDAIAEMRTRVQLVGDVLKTVCLLIEDAGRRLIATKKKSRMAEFNIRGTAYLVVPPLKEDAPGSHRICRIARHAADESTLDNTPTNVVALSTGQPDEVVAIRSLRNNQFYVGPGNDQGTKRPWKTVLVAANPIRFADSAIELDAHGVVTFDVLVKQGLSTKRAVSLQRAIGWDTPDAVGTPQLKKALVRVALICSKIIARTELDGDVLKKR